MGDYTNQISVMKQEKEDGLKGDRELRRKIEQLQDKIEQLEHEQENSERKHLDVSIVDFSTGFGSSLRL